MSKRRKRRVRMEVYGSPEALAAHRDLQFLRSVALGTVPPGLEQRRRNAGHQLAKRSENERQAYFKQRYEKLLEGGEA